jgi:hypothetical protein
MSSGGARTSEANRHVLKIEPMYFIAVCAGSKRYELRKDDRDFKIGDVLVLSEYANGYYSGRYVCREINSILRNCEKYGLMKGYVILGLKG